MATVTTKQKNPGRLDKINKRYKQNKNVLVVGFPKELVDSVRYPSVRKEYEKTPGEQPPRVTDVAFENEFGSRSKGVPSRPFMSLSGKPAAKLMKKETAGLVRKLNGKSATNNLQTKFLRLMGPKITAIFRNTITDLRTPANSPATIAIKKSDNPLKDTGLMGSTLTHLVTKRKKSSGGVV